MELTGIEIYNKHKSVIGLSQTGKNNYIEIPRKGLKNYNYIVINFFTARYSRHKKYITAYKKYKSLCSNVIQSSFVVIKEIDNQKLEILPNNIELLLD